MKNPAPVPKKHAPLREAIFLSLLLAAVTLAIYWQVGGHEFVNYDDPRYITDHRMVQGGLTWKGVRGAFTTFYAGNWHPLTWMSHMLDVELYGLDPAGHHFTNLGLHILNTLLLFWVLASMTGAIWPSAFVAALFAVHPLHVESVAWAAERKDVLSTFFWMLAMGAYLRYARGPSLQKYLTILAAFAFGLMAKPMVVTLPFVLLLLDYWPLGRFRFADSGEASSRFSPAPLSRLLQEKIPLFALAAAGSAVTYLAQQKGGAVGSLEHFPLWVRVQNALVAYAGYLEKMVWPQKLAVFYPHPGETLPVWQAAASGLFLTAVTFWVIRWARHLPCLPVGWFWYLGTLVPVIGLVQVGTQAMADRYTYVPLIGLFVMLAGGVLELAKGWRYRRFWLTLASGGVVMALTAAAWFQAGTWKNSIALFEHTVNVTQNNYVAHTNLGEALFREGKTDEAATHFSKAIEIKADYDKAHVNLGVVMAMRGRMEEAVDHFSRALKANGENEEAHYNYARAMALQGRFEEAVLHYRETLRIRPDYASAHYNLGGLLSSLGRREEAIGHFRAALRIKPDHAKARRKLEALLGDR